MQRQARSGLPRWPQGHGRVAFFLPRLQFTLHARKPKDFAECPLTLGEHIKRRRKLAWLTQAEVGCEVGVTEFTVMHWEHGKTTPPIASVPAIIAFLGYDPTPQPVTLSERMHHYRMVQGLSIKEAAAHAGVHEDSWGLWERTGVVAWGRHKVLLEQVLARRWTLVR